MAAKRIAQSSINWVEMAERCPEAQKIIYINLKAKSDSYLRRVHANPETAPKIDWAFYKTHVPVAGMVDNFQKQYESLKVPYPADTYSSQIDEMAKKGAKRMEDFIVGSNARIVEYEAEIKRIQAMLPFDQMTVEDWNEAYPEEAYDMCTNPTWWPHTKEEIEYDNSYEWIQGGRKQPLKIEAKAPTATH